MHWIQQELLGLAKVHDIAHMRRADLMNLVGCKYQSQIDHHLSRLISNEQLVKKGGRLVPALAEKGSLLRIPIMGEADCGEATKYADGRITDYLSVSPSLISGASKTESIYALIARGDSMNHAIVAGKEIESGDYVVVEKKDAYEPSDGDIIVSDIGGLANVKRFQRDSKNNRIVLRSDSYRQEDFAPIIISENDDYNVLGKVVEVVKAIPN